MTDWTASQIQAPYRYGYGFGAPSMEQIDPLMQQYSQAGLNLLQVNPWWEQTPEWKGALSEAAQKYQMGIVPWALFDPSKREELITQYAQDPSIFGWMLYDEPTGLGSERVGAAYQEIKGYDPTRPLISTYTEPRWGQNIGPGLTDIATYVADYPFFADISSDPYEYTKGKVGLYEGTLRQAIEAGIDVLPVLQAFTKEGYPVPDIGRQYEAYMEAFPEFTPGAMFYESEGTRDIIDVPELTQYVQALLGQWGGTPYEPPIVPIPPVPPTDGDEGEPKPPPEYPPDYIPPLGGERMAGQQYYFGTEPYPFDIRQPPTYPSWIPEYQETFPWARSYYPYSLGPGGDTETYIPGFPQYRLFPYKPPTYAGEQYQGMQVPGTFFEGVQTPQLQDYLAGQLGRYPTYGGFEGALAQPTQQTIADLLGGVGVGIPYEAEQYQQAMGRITEAQRGGIEEIGRIAARTGRAESGLTWGPGGEAEEFITEMGKTRAGVAQDFAIRTAEMQQEARQAAVPMALAEMQFGAGQAQAVAESRERAWGAETTDLFEQYRSKLQVATTDYDMRTAQNEMIQAGEERAWRAYNEEYTKQYQAAKEAGIEEYKAQQQAWQAATQQWEMLYQSVRIAAQQEFDWVVQNRAWSVGFEMAPRSATFWDYLGLGATNLLGSLGK